MCIAELRSCVLTQEFNHRVNPKRCKHNIFASHVLRVCCKPPHFHDLTGISIRGFQNFVPELLYTQVAQSEVVDSDIKELRSFDL